MSHSRLCYYSHQFWVQVKPYSVLNTVDYLLWKVQPCHEDEGEDGLIMLLSLKKHKNHSEQQL
ncbi:hypothetical protein WG66_016932 [Moniliophthora roreri]|nr:hypothetical protein WG66_016932 [Moniliophthora roreri]